MNPLDAPLNLRLPAKLAKKLEKAGINTVGDLLLEAPRRYYHWGALTPMHILRSGEDVTILAEVVSTRLIPNRSRAGVRLEVLLTDGTSQMSATFFAANPYKLSVHERLLQPGEHFLFAGKVGSYRGNLQLVHPEFEGVEDDQDDRSLRERSHRPIPIYSSKGGITSWVLARAITVLLESIDLDSIPDPIPDSIRRRYDIDPLGRSLLLLHQGTSDEEVARAKKNLRWREAFILQAFLAHRRLGNNAMQACVSPHSSPELTAFLSSLPFTLTDSQKKAIEHIGAGLADSHPMQRLLEGDVGSGKTVVALAALIQVVAAGHQGALLAPTEVLAKQHVDSIRALLAPLEKAGFPIDLRLLTSSTPAPARREIERLLASGAPLIVVGTHALLFARNLFADLALAVIDEQHRFGVQQRDALRESRSDGLLVHQLVMTATPIPRSVAMTIFGDLDVTVMKGLPKGRQPVATYVVDAGNEVWMSRMWQRAREEIDGGGRVYIVCPRIDDSDTSDALLDSESSVPLASVSQTLLGLSEIEPLRGIGAATLTGRDSSEDKEAIMSAFASGERPILVATTVIEVGVDVPEATMMIILDAQQFGLSQLHQLRGRVGRSSRASVCMAVHPSAITDTSAKRLEAFASTTDGFVLAEADLALRREGDVLGSAQSGKSSRLRFLSVVRDGEIIEEARSCAQELLASDPDLSEHTELRQALNDASSEELVWMERS